MTTISMIRALRRSRLAWLVFLAGMALTTLAWYAASAWEEEKSRQEFTVHANDTLDAIRQRLDAYIYTLYGMRGLFAASHEVTRDEFRRYIAEAGLGGHHPGVHSFAFIRYVSPQEKARFERRVRGDTSVDNGSRPGFAISPPGERGDYFPIEYIEPESRYRHLLGVDRGAAPDTRQMLERARDSDRPEASGRLLSAGENLDAGRYFLIALPIYRNGSNPVSAPERRAALVGFVTARIELEALFKDVVGAGILEELFFEIYDFGVRPAGKTPPMARENLLYAKGNAPYAEEAMAKPRFTHRAAMEVAGRDWQYFFGSRAGRSGVGGYLPAVVFVGGVVVSALMSLLVLILVTQRRRVMAEVARQKSLFSQVVDALPANIFLKDKDFRFVLVNAETANMLGTTQEAAIGKTDFDVFPREVATALRADDEHVRSVERLVMREERLVSGGQEKFMLAGKKVIRLPGSDEPMLLGFSFDISDRKKVERELEQQQQFIRQVIDNDPNIISVSDRDGTSILVNKAGAAYFGTTPEQSVGRNLAEIFPRREDFERVSRIDRQVIDERRSIDMEESITLPNGEELWLSTSKRPLLQPDGKVHVLVIATNITERKRAELALRESEERLRAILDNTTSVVFLKDVEGRYLLVNSEYEKRQGLSREQVIGKTDYDLYPKALADSLRANDQIVLRTGRPMEFEEVVPSEGEEHTFIAVKFVLRNAAGEPYAVAGIATDITERLHLEQEAARGHANEWARSLTNAVGEGLIGVDMLHQIVFANPKAQEILGIAEGEMLGRKLDDVVLARTNEGDDLTDDTCPAWDMIAEGRSFQTDDWSFLRGDGSRFPVSLVIAPICDNQETAGSVMSFQDISLRKRAEEELGRHMTELARVNAELDEFTYVASHDLQEPVRKLVAFSDLLRKDMGGNMPPRAEQDLTFITDAALRMQRLVKDLLALSRTGKVSMAHEYVALDDAVDQALDALELRIAESGATINRVPLPMVWGDLMLLTQLYQNLIGNALKFVDGPHPEIFLTAEQVAGEWVFGVRDNGIGIDPQYMEQIFQPFKRLHGQGKFEGSGVGLSICRKVVERHGGRIWVESGGNRGTWFKFVLGRQVASPSQ